MPAKTRTPESYREEINVLFSGEYKVLGDYINNRTKIETMHVPCGFVWGVLPVNLTRGSRCPKCKASERGKSQRKTPEEYSSYVKEITNGEYSVLGDYVTKNEKILHRHEVCGYEYEIQPQNFMTGKRCYRCRIEAQKITHEEYIDRVYKIYGNEYVVIGKYTKSINKIKHLHRDCGTVFNTSPNSLVNSRHGCPLCSKSKGEKRIAKLLKERGITFRQQYLLDECRGKKRPLPFDFGVLSEEGNLLALIEYDGELHYKEVPEFGGKKTLERTKQCDSIKSEYCKKNRIPLIRIPYWDYDNISIILSYELGKINSQQRNGVVSYA